jgi:hypothetical protein
MSTETTTDAGMHQSIVYAHCCKAIADDSDTMENRDKAREIYIQQRELFLQEEREKREEKAKDKAWIREKAGLANQLKNP